MKPKNLIRNLIVIGLFIFSLQSLNAQVKVLSNGKTGFGQTNPQWGTIEIGNDGKHSGLAI